MAKKPTFDTIGDEPIEARIVAWVLGDASAFEAAELERLCEERPELLVFRRRMLALHGLLSEAAVPNPTTKLPPAKRQALDAIFGAPQPAALPGIGQAARTRHGWRRSVLAIAACLVLLVALGGFFGAGSMHRAKKLSLAGNLVPLQTDYPPELIEGTPRPIVLNRAAPAPANAPATPNLALRSDAQPGRSPGKPQAAAKAEEYSVRLPQAGAAPATTTPAASKAAADDRSALATTARGVLTDAPSGGVKRDLTSQDEGWIASDEGMKQKKSERMTEELAGKSDLSDRSDKSDPAALAADKGQPLRPSGPASRVVASGFGPTIPVPDDGGFKPSTNFGDGDDFGTGWGSGSAAADAKPVSGTGGQSPDEKRERERLGRDLAAHGAPMPAPQAENGEALESGLRGDAADARRKPVDALIDSETGVVAGELHKAAKDSNGSEDLAARRHSAALVAPGEAAASPDGKSTSDLIRDFDRRSEVTPPAGPAATRPVVAAEPVPAAEAKAAAPAGAKPPAAHETAAPVAGGSQPAGEGKELALAKKIADAGGTPVSGRTLKQTLNGGTLKVNEAEAMNQAGEGDQAAVLTGLAQREMLRRQSVVVDSDRFLVEARDAYTKGTYQQAYDNYAKALALLPDAPATKDRRDFLRKALGDVALALANEAIDNGRSDAANEWLGKAVEWDPNNAKARQKVVADVASEIAAAEVPYSTFSLSISDASFKMAQAALARGERPDPASIKVEQFYNAVDYGDPAPGAGEAVAARVEQAAHPVIPGRNLVRVALRTGAAGRSAAQPLRLTLLVDQSGSMAREDRRAAMEVALKQLGGLLTKNDLVTVIGFSRTPRLLADALTGDQGAKLNGVVNQAASEGGTNLEEAMMLGEQMALRHQTAGAQNRLVLFTDGAANLGNADPLRLAERVKGLRQKGLAFDIAGIGTSNLNDQLLGELARHGNGRYCVVGAEKDASGSFARQLAGAFRPAAENVKVQVRFNPLRVGHYKLLGFEEHRLKTEDFRNDAVDAAELAAEEAGVALYQVEPLAEGSGEIGEVSVRFRDAASGRMVERTWTIPYEASAPAFDRALPSLQLAGLALLAADKLRGGPLAGAIDFKQLSAPRATVKQYYSNSRRVAEMLEMVNRL